MFRKEGDLVPTNTIFLTFCTPTLPQSIKVGYLNVKVSLYVPSPLRCFRCQKFGHVRDRCPGEEVCGTCAQPPHQGPCSDPASCVNCKGQHPSSSRQCPTWKTEEAVQRVKTEKRIPFFEARKLVLASQPAQTYAQAVQKIQSRSVQCQTDISCFTDDIPDLRVKKPTSQPKKSCNVQTVTEQPGPKSPAPSLGNKQTPPANRPSEGETDREKSTVPVGPPGSGPSAKVKETMPVVVENTKPPPKPPQKIGQAKAHGSRSGGSSDRSRKGHYFAKLTNKFAPLQSKEVEQDAGEEEMEER